MPKIDVNEEAFFALAGAVWHSREEFEEALTCAKAELDEDSDKSLPASERILKIELNDTNRPDLWATAGCARQLRIYHGQNHTRPEYPFFSRPGAPQKAVRKVKVEKTVKGVRPYLAGFVASGKAITDASLKDMIQTQEKLAWNFGRKRKTISMGLYRIAVINWPVVYKAVDPDSVAFVPLQWEGELTLREILKQHPKGKEYGWIQEHEPLHPLLVDADGKVLSYPPIINSADLGAVQVGDRDLFVELTGTDMPSVTLAASIVACDLADQGFTIEPVEVEYEYETPFSAPDSDGKSRLISPYYFQEPVFCSLKRVERFLGEKLSASECLAALQKMGVKAEALTACERGSSETEEGVKAWPPEYRNDYLHAADVAEDIMVGRGLGSFKPLRPSAFTVGRLSPLTMYSRRVKETMVGLGFQEMIYNYLGSKQDFIDKMRVSGDKIIRIANPMTENYEYVRDSILPSLLASETVSGHAVYPHRIFEVGKVAYLNPEENYLSSTRQYLGFIEADRDANFNGISAQIQTLFYYISRVFTAAESADSRFIPGRAAAILYKGKQVGVYGELHPEVLASWGVAVPAAACEVDIEALL